MTGFAEIKAYHQAYKIALELHREWSRKPESELLAIYSKVRPLLDPLIEIAGTEWPRHTNLLRHLNVIKHSLENEKKIDSGVDINDLIYSDLPALADRIFILASV